MTLDEDFCQPAGLDPDAWSLPLHCASPDLREVMRDMRTHPADITAEMLAPLAPGLGEIDQSRDSGLPRLALAMARAASVQSAAAWVLQNPRPDALFVHLAWLGEVRDGFEGAAEPYASVIDGAWRFLDSLVGRLVELAGQDTLVLVVSPGHRANPGAFIAAGAGLSAERPLAGVSALQVAPTVLAHFGLRADLSAPPIALGGATTLRSAPKPAPPAPADMDLASLAIVEAAGYAPPQPAPAQWRAQAAAELAAALVEEDPRGALALADEALDADPDCVLALGVKAMALVALQEAAPLSAVGERLMALAPESGWGPLAKAVRCLLSETPDAAVPWLRRAEVDKRPEVRLRVAGIWIAANRPAEAARLYRKVLRQTPQEASAHLGLGMAALARRDFHAAEAALREAIRLDPSKPAPHLQLAHIYAVTARPADAAASAKRAVALGADRDQAAAASRGHLGPDVA